MSDEAGRPEAGNREAQAAELEADLARACGTLNMAAAAQVQLIAKVLESGSYAASGVRSAEQWVAWQCGVSLAHARQLVRMARRLPELPATGAAFAAGELAEDQVAVICRHVPAHNDAEAAELARFATVSQLRRVLGRYGFAPAPKPPAEPEPDAEPPEPKRVWFGFGDDGSWRLSGLLPPDEGAGVERALALARQELINAAEGEEDKRAVTWPTPWWRWPSATSPPRWRPAPTPSATWCTSTSRPTPRAASPPCTWARSCPTPCAARWPATPRGASSSATAAFP